MASVELSTVNVDASDAASPQYQAVLSPANNGPQRRVTFSNAPQTPTSPTACEVDSDWDDASVPTTSRHRTSSVLGADPTEPLHKLLFKALCGIDGKANKRNLTVMLFILCLAIGVAVFQYYLARSREQWAAQQQFEQFATTFFLAVSNAWHQYETLPQMMANYIATQTSPGGNLTLTDERFQRFADPVGTFWDFNIVNHIEWVPNVEGEPARAAMEADMRAQLKMPANSSFGFFVFNTSALNGSTPVGTRPYYFPIQYVAPCCMYDFNIGFDLGSDPIELPYINAARQTGRPITTHAFDLRGPKWVGYKYPKGLIMFFPVHYNSTYNKTVTTGNGDRFLGMVAPVIVIHKLLRATLLERLSQLPNMHVFLYDVTNPSAPAYLGQIASDNAPQTWPKDASLSYVLNVVSTQNGFIFNEPQHEFSMYNRRFRVVTMATGDFRDPFLTFLPWALIIIALLSRFAINFSQAMRRTAFTDQLRRACSCCGCCASGCGSETDNQITAHDQVQKPASVPAASSASSTVAGTESPLRMPAVQPSSVPSVAVRVDALQAMAIAHPSSPSTSSASLSSSAQTAPTHSDSQV